MTDENKNAVERSSHKEPVLQTSPYATKGPRVLPPMRMSELPFITLALPEMELFDPADASLNLPPLFPDVLPLFQAARMHSKRTFIPRGEDCRALWDAYGMLDNVRAHSQKVACFTLGLAQMINAAGGNVDEDLAYAARMLHDLGKTYCIKYTGNHAQIGAAWVMRETRNGPLARAVLTHVHWPWEDRLEACANDDVFFASLAVVYADKRVRHDEYVGVDERFEDLQTRYGFSEQSRKSIEGSRQQGKKLEAIFSKRLGRDLNEYTPDCGRLVR